MINPLAVVTQGFISEGSHFPLLVSIQGLLIFAVVSTTTSNTGSPGEEEEDERGDRFRRRQEQQRTEDEIFAIINAFLATQ